MGEAACKEQDCFYQELFICALGAKKPADDDDDDDEDDHEKNKMNQE